MSFLQSLKGALGGGRVVPHHVPARTMLPADQLARVAVASPDDLTITLSRTSLLDISDAFRSARTSIHGELFTHSEQSMIDAVRGAAERGVRQRYLVEPERYDAIVKNLPDSVEATSYGAVPLKNHSKGYVIDGTHAIMTTGAFVGKTNGRLEMVARFQGDAARALDELIEAGSVGDARRLQAATANAARYGIVMNEPVAGVQYLTGSVHELIRGAKRDLTISTKIFTDPTVRKAVQRAEARGVRVRFTDIRAKEMHANLIVADDSLYIGTAHFSPRSMGDMRLAYRRSRESGIVLHDADQARAIRQALDHEEMVAYLPDEFEQSRIHYTKMDAYWKAKEDGVTGAKLAQAAAERETALAHWRDLGTEVKARRAEDGITFTNPGGT